MNLLGKALPPLATLLPFEAAARLGSFSRAAEELHITQAAVSRQIRGLEENLGLKLFSRRNRSVFLTPEGIELARVVGSALGAIGNTAEAMRGRLQTHQVVLLCQLCEGFYWLMPRLSRFHLRHPQIEIQVVTTTQPLSRFDGHFDVALQSTGRDSGSHQLMFTASDQVFPVCSPDYLAIAPGSLTIDELQQHVLLHHRSSIPHLMEWSSWLRRFEASLAESTRGQFFDNYPMVLQAAVQGHGIALGWRRTADRLIDNGALFRPCVESVSLPKALSVYSRPEEPPRQQVQALLEWLEQEFNEEDSALRPELARPANDASLAR
ncbi:LysR substrate-binding domain-containing protein [Pseudomonas protegens]|uniref:LysR substrate-binding domain-containing protein n=1 Tax=Pseudomonas protegens TaxID=380021 RepID=UPI001474C8EA|nr:LysR substrate-binding domain-containing protein [Pseudomonas protegens]NMZ29643.1 LysR family transcriptional regulator [Pseudomonas protegens]NMZ86617.1 LysR family transcriptional regulator [Pseudomonas protegens]